MKRPLRWQLEKQRTAKAIRELPKCETRDCKKRGMGFVTVYLEIRGSLEAVSLWFCPEHAAAQRAQRERT